MAWEGERLKALAKERRMTITYLAERLQVSRQAVNDWIKGQVPTGRHLMAINKVFGVNPGYFFSDEITSHISVPLHRKRGAAKISQKTRDESFGLAEQYEKLFKWAPSPGLVQTLRVDKKDEQSAVRLAGKLRKMSGIESAKPMDYLHTFNLLNNLNIVTIFRYFPESIKAYAFYSKIHKHRVVFVDNKTNLLDLIFPLLHETIHAIGDDEDIIYNKQTEEFCDGLANYTQFPEDYVLEVYNAIKEKTIPQQINTLKFYSTKYGHSIFGMITQLKKLDSSIEISVGGADTNLKKGFKTIGDILFEDKDPRIYIQTLTRLSPTFMDIVANQIEGTSIRQIGEWLGLDNTIDAEQACNELKRAMKAN